MFGISAFSQTAFSSLASGVVFASGQIDATAIVTADAYRIRLCSGAIDANASVTADGYSISLC
jgi:hypothetical protein